MLASPNRSTDESGELSLVVVREVEDAPLPGKRSPLLILERDAWGKRRNMPMNVAVPLLTTEADHVETLCGHRPANRLPNAVHDSLQRRILVLGEVARHLLTVLAWGDEDVPVESRILVQKGNGELVLVDDMAPAAIRTGDDAANEAASPNLREIVVEGGCGDARPFGHE
jgi:hypothetical protein